MAASGKRNFTDRFPAMNPKGGWSRPDPYPPDDIFIDHGGFTIALLSLAPPAKLSQCVLLTTFFDLAVALNAHRQGDLR